MSGQLENDASHCRLDTSQIATISALQVTLKADFPTSVLFNEVIVINKTLQS